MLKRLVNAACLALALASFTPAHAQPVPPPTGPVTPPPPTGPVTPPLGDVVATQQYYAALSGLLRDAGAVDAFSYQQLAYLFNTFAAQIDALPILNVDPELLAFGHQVSVTFRGLAGLDEAVELQSGYLAGVAISSFVVPIGYNPVWGWPCGGVFYAYADLSGIAAMATYQLYAFEINVRATVWSNILDTKDVVRINLTQRYQVEFTDPPPAPPPPPPSPAGEPDLTGN